MVVIGRDPLLLDWNNAVRTNPDHNDCNSYLAVKTVNCLRVQNATHSWDSQWMMLATVGLIAEFAQILRKSKTRQRFGRFGSLGANSKLPKSYFSLGSLKFSGIPGIQSKRGIENFADTSKKLEKAKHALSRLLPPFFPFPVKNYDWDVWSFCFVRITSSCARTQIASHCLVG